MRETARYSRYFTYIRPITKIPIIRSYGSTIFTLIIIVVFIFFAIKPTIETILVLQKKLEDSNKILAQLNKKSDDLTRAKENYDNLDSSIKNKIEEAIPDKANFTSFVQAVENLTKTHDASISALQIQPITLVPKLQQQVGTIAQVEFTLNIEGLYPNLVSILQDLRSSSRVISIETVTLNKLSEGSGLIMSINGKSYYLK